MVVGQAGQNIAVRMSEAVLKSVGNDSKRRRNRTQKHVGTGGFAAMMAHLQDIALYQAVISYQPELQFLFHVAGQQEFSLAVGDAQHERVIILGVRFRLVVRRWRKRFYACFSVREAWAGSHGNDLRAVPASLFFNRSP